MYLNANVAMAAINSLKSLSDKAEAVKILDDTINLNTDEDVKNKAKEVKELICCN